MVHLHLLFGCPCVLQNKEIIFGKRKLQTGRCEVLRLRKVKAAVAASAPQTLQIIGAIVLPDGFDIQKGQLIHGSPHIQAFIDEVPALCGDGFYPLPFVFQILNVEQFAEGRVCFRPAGGIRRVIIFVDFVDVDEHAVCGSLGNGLVTREDLPAEDVKIHQRAVDNRSEGGDIDDHGLFPLLDLALDHVDQLVVPELLYFIEHAHVNIPPVKVAAVRRQRLEFAVFVIGPALRHLDMLRENGRAGDLRSALCKYNPRLLF